MADELRAARDRLRTYRHKHGGTGTPTYGCWKSMMARCMNRKHKRYSDYGGRGITVCERWRSFETFLADMGPRPSKGHSIDRFPNQDGNYEPVNCRWATRRQQKLNSKQARVLTINGVSMAALEWSEQPGAVNYECLLGRLYRGWEPEQAVFCPPQKAGGTPDDHRKRRAEAFGR